MYAAGPGRGPHRPPHAVQRRPPAWLLIFGFAGRCSTRERPRPAEQTTLYRLVQQHAASFIAHTEASTGAELPRFIRDEFDAFSSAASWRMRLPAAAAAASAATTSCWPSAASARGFCPHAVRAHAADRLRTWSTTSSRTCRCGNGCCRCRSRLRVLLAAQPELVTPVLQVVQRGHATSAGWQPGSTVDEGHGGARHADPALWLGRQPQHPPAPSGTATGCCCDADGSPAFIEAWMRPPTTSCTRCCRPSSPG